MLSYVMNSLIFSQILIRGTTQTSVLRHVIDDRFRRSTNRVVVGYSKRNMDNDDEHDGTCLSSTQCATDNATQQQTQGAKGSQKEILVKLLFI
jgi:hypothetical protein